MLDFPFVPANIFQLIGRMDRIGQLSPFINVFFLLMDSTIEHNLFQTLQARQLLTDKIFDDNLSGTFDLSSQEFISLL